MSLTADTPWDDTVVRRYLLPSATSTGRPVRVLLECALCLDGDPDRCVGHLVGACGTPEAERLMRNHLAQHHDILPRRQEPLNP